MSAQWKTFLRNEEQVKEILEAEHGILIKGFDGKESAFKKLYAEKDEDNKLYLTDNYLTAILPHNIKQYLICERHPHADMIIEWARTGRYVYRFHDDIDKWIFTPMPSWYWEEKYSFNADGDGK